MKDLSILLVATECVPFAKTGGMADVVYSLAKELSRLKVKVSVFMPFYRIIKEKAQVKDLGSKTLVRIGSSYKEVSFFQSVLPGTEVPLYLVRRDDYFFRDQLYGEEGRDYADNLNRFVLLAKAVLNFILLSEMPVDLIHCNDWHTALVPTYLRLLFRDQALRSIKTLFTIHNLSYQGIFPMNDFVKLNLSWEYFTHDTLEYFGKMNLLKAGIVFSDAINTVSPTYRDELMQSDSFSKGLTGVLNDKKENFFGILNGADYSFWRPLDYDENSLEKKQKEKEVVLQKAGLADAKSPLLVMVSRMVGMKGFDILAAALPDILKQKVNVMILGEGDPAIEKNLKKIEKQYKNFKLFLEFNEARAKQLLAAGDILLMPSQTEPCGLSQIYALKFGTVPVVHHTGGLADTVVDYRKDKQEATGFAFFKYHPDSLKEAIGNALNVYENKEEWVRIQKNGMKKDFSWQKSAQEYLSLYEKLCS